MTGAAVMKVAGGLGDSWGTPFDLWDEILDRYFSDGIPIFDPCPNRDRVIPLTYSGLTVRDGLGDTWGGNVFVNPPFSSIEPWVKKAWETSFENASTKIVMLLPVRADQAWWHMLEGKAKIVFLRGRVNYVDPAKDKTAGASFASCLVVFGDRVGVDFWWPLCHQNRRRA